MRSSPRSDSARIGWQKPGRVLLAFAAAALLSACAAEKPLPKCDGQIRVLNPGKWSSTENDLKSACLPGTATLAALSLGTRS
jgi:hypothetical protein